MLEEDGNQNEDLLGKRNVTLKDDEPIASGVHITVFERGDVGGRMATVNIGGFDYEVGINRMHNKNQLMRELVDALGTELDRHSK